jgi:hypothetical protein
MDDGILGMESEEGYVYARNEVSGRVFATKRG